jgi:hypothetical protein
MGAPLGRYSRIGQVKGISIRADKPDGLKEKEAEETLAK